MHWRRLSQFVYLLGLLVCLWSYNQWLRAYGGYLSARIWYLRTRIALWERGRERD